MSSFNTPDESVQDTVAQLINQAANTDVVYNDANDTLTVSLTDSVSVNTLEAIDSITDPSGISHTDELADSTDISPIQSSGDVTVTDAQAGTLADGEFLKNNSGSLEGANVQSFGLTDLVTTNGWYWHTLFPSIDGFSQVNTGTGTTSIDGAGAVLNSGTDPLSDGTLVKSAAEPIVQNRNYSWDNSWDAAYGVEFTTIGSNRKAFIGIGDPPANFGSANQIGFTLNENTLSGSVADGDTRTTTTLTNSVEESQSFQLRFEYDPQNGVTFFVNESASGSITSGLPSGIQDFTLFNASVFTADTIEIEMRISEVRMVREQ